jgi:Tol biopolymer transport system component
MVAGWFADCLHRVQGRRTALGDGCRWGPPARRNRHPERRHRGGFSPDWSPDGTTIAFEVFDGHSWNIYTVHPDGTDLRPLAIGPGDEIQPVWSPDGLLVAYMASPQGSGTGGDNTGTYDVHTTRLDGSVTRVTTDAWGAGGSLAWQPLPDGADA